MFLELDKKSRLQKKAFSLIELSIVILIIGIIIAGVTQSTYLVTKFKLSSARSLTLNSPVSSIKDLSMWLETTSIKSFDDLETENSTDTGSGITNWYDINPTSSVKHDATASSTAKPYYYSNCINGLPCLRFDGSDDFMSFDGSFLVGTDYTIFVVERRNIASGKFFIGSSSTNSINNGLQIGYNNPTWLMFSQGSFANSYYQIGDTADPRTFQFYAPTTLLHAITSSIIARGGPGSSSFNHHLNGASTETAKIIAGTDGSNWTTLDSYPNAAIGRGNATLSWFFSGDIAEIIFYTRALKAEERIDVESYLLKKWGIRKM